MENNLQMEINKISTIFKNSFINGSNELILEPRNNIYFRLEDVKTVLDFRCKFIAWVSRPSCKGLGKYWQPRIRTMFNSYLETSFTYDEIYDLIYPLLGNDVNRNLCERFVESGYDLEILKSYRE